MIAVISTCGRLFQVTQARKGLCYVVEINPDGEERRYLSLDLPARTTRRQAESDMKKWAVARGHEVLNIKN